MKVQMVELKKDTTYLVQVPDTTTDEELDMMVDIFNKRKISIIIVPVGLTGDITKVDEGRIIEFIRPYLKDIIKAIEESVK